MAELTLTQEMKIQPVIVPLAAGHSDSEIAAFLKVARSFFYKVRRELEIANGDMWQPFRTGKDIAGAQALP